MTITETEPNRAIVLEGFAGFACGTAVVDIWRLEDGLIVAHWDVVQPVPDAAEVPNGMF